MTEPCMFPNLHEPFYCRIHADVRLRLTDERCRRGVTLTQPQPDDGLREADRVREAEADVHRLLLGMVTTSWPLPRNQYEKGWNEALNTARKRLAALRSTPAAPTHTPKVMEAEAGRLLVESARIRAARLGPDDAHELRHLWAAINAGNSDPCGETCHLDADAIARWTEQYPKVMGLVALRSTPTARKPDARSLADRITGVIAIPPDGEVEP